MYLSVKTECEILSYMITLENAALSVSCGMSIFFIF